MGLPLCGAVYVYSRFETGVKCALMMQCGICSEIGQLNAIQFP